MCCSPRLCYGWPRTIRACYAALTGDGISALRNRITDAATAPVFPDGGNTSDTTYICAIDADGNAVSLMSSICGVFGSGLLAGETGVILNNRASLFSTRRGHPNALTAGHRPRHTILPGMVMRNGSPEYVLGCIGLNNHPQAQVQMLVNAIDLGMNPQQAVDAPRFRVVMTNDQVPLDSGFPAQVGYELNGRGHHTGDPYDFKGAAQMVRIHRGEDGIGPCLETEWTTGWTASHSDGDTRRGMRRGILTAMAVSSPVSPRLTVVALLSLTFATGLVDAISVLVLGHVFVANMTGNVIFLGFWFAPHSGVDLTAAAVAFVSFVIGTIIGGRCARHLDQDVRRWLTVALGAEVVALLVLAVLAGTSVLDYHGAGRLILIVGLATVFGAQSVFARRFGIQELSTTVLTGTIVSIGSDSRLAGGTGEGEKLRFTVVLTMCAGAVVGATLSRFVVAPVIALAAMSVATALAIFLFGRPD